MVGAGLLVCDARVAGCILITDGVQWPSSGKQPMAAIGSDPWPQRVVTCPASYPYVSLTFSWIAASSQTGTNQLVSLPRRVRSLRCGTMHARSAEARRGCRLESRPDHGPATFVTRSPRLNSPHAIVPPNDPEPNISRNEHQTCPGRLPAVRQFPPRFSILTAATRYHQWPRNLPEQTDEWAMGSLTR